MFRKFREAIRNYTIKRDEKKILRKSLKEWINESGIDDQKKRNRKKLQIKLLMFI